jgi:small nuclear ribonucleoprotein (snRNP)-like protein
MSSVGNEGKLPSIAELQRFIKNGERLTFKTVDGGSYTGKLRWFDEQAFCLALDNGEFTLVKSNVIGYGVNRKK